MFPYPMYVFPVIWYLYVEANLIQVQFLAGIHQDWLRDFHQEARNVCLPLL